MHELSLAGAVVDTAERHAAGRRVLMIQLRLGELRQVVPDSLAFYFEHVARGTLCEGAVLEYETVAARLCCRRCGTSWELADSAGTASFRCARCGAADVAIEAGNEFEVESIEVEEPACTG
jgi:hydrogenase nickel incorporation protein HypA/HybF